MQRFFVFFVYIAETNSKDENMKYPLLILFLSSLLFSSCVTIFSDRCYSLKVTSDQPETQIFYKCEKLTVPAKIEVSRSESPLLLTIVKDSIQSELSIPPRLRYSFWIGNVLWLSYAAPIGWLIDLETPKRFSYGREIAVSVSDTIAYTVKYPLFPPVKKYPEKKGNLNLLFSLPEINPSYLHPLNEPAKKQVGLLGIGAGIEYYYKNNKFLQFRADAMYIGDFSLAESFYDYPYDWEDSADWKTQESSDHSNSYNFSLTDNWKTGHFTLGYGLNYAINRWREHTDYWHTNNWAENGYIPEIDYDEDKHQISHSLGFAFNTYYQFTKYFYVGVIYRPSVYRILPKQQFRYEHLISIDLAWKISLHK
jgi:hypothetical protein